MPIPAPRRLTESGDLAGCHANPIIFHFNDQTRPGQAAAQVDAAAFHLRSESVLD